jgi:hypothetical protein
MQAEPIRECTVGVKLDEPVLVAQTVNAKEPWGIWQFPAITRPSPDMLEVSFNLTVDDSTLDTASKMNVPGACVSTDNGRTWRRSETSYGLIKGGYNDRAACVRSNGDILYLQGPPARDVAKSDLPKPVGTCDSGYRSVYTIRDPRKMPPSLMEYHLMRRPKGSQKWERSIAIVDDPDGGMVSFDPPGAAHAVVHGRFYEQMLELPDRSLLAIGYGYRIGQDRKPHPKFESWCLRSVDSGRTWKFHGVMARDDGHPLAGFTEPRATVLRDGSLLAVLRTECNRAGPMFRTRSTDGGKTWSAPTELWPFGVLPQLLTLENGVTVLAFGRPGAHCLFSCDGKGEQWQQPTHLVIESFEGTGIKGEGYGFQKGEEPQGRPKQTRTSGYTSLLQFGPDSCLIAYDQFDYPDKDGNPRKSILVRKVAVTPGGRP